eukprot:1009807-Pelagomonas_calceolata.AAC.1
MKLPGWSCAASYFFITSRTAEHPIGGSGWSICVSRARRKGGQFRMSGSPIRIYTVFIPYNTYNARIP